MNNMGGIRSHIKSIKQTVKISSAQKLIAGAHIVKARKMLERSQPYHERIRRTMASVLRDCEKKSRYLDTGKEIKKRGLLVISADRGLAGGYNQNVIKLAIQAITEHTAKRPADKAVKLLTVGHAGYGKFEHMKILNEPLDEDFICAVENPSLSTSHEIADRMIRLFENDEVDCFDVIYTYFQSAVHMIPSTERLFPLSPEILGEPIVHFSEYEPSPDAVLKTLIPQYIKGYIFGCLTQAWMCELNSRVTAMESAIKNGNEMVRKLALKYNRARQGSITQELTEIVAGAASME